MTVLWWTMAGVPALTVAAALLAWFRLRKRRHFDRFAQVRKLFHARREWLEAEFITRASDGYEPRGLVWSDCEFDEEVIFATDRNTGQLRAFVAISVRIESKEEDVMPDDAFADSLRAATAVFHFDGGKWTTEGRTLFNLNPLEAIDRFKHELEMIE